MKLSLRGYEGSEKADENLLRRELKLHTFALSLLQHKQDCSKDKPKKMFYQRDIGMRPKKVRSMGIYINPIINFQGMFLHSEGATKEKSVTDHGTFKNTMGLIQ